ncbi:mannose-6-phosphate isomerase, class I [Microbacterium sp. BWT-B31]|uniref:mannose-6-phosphate isomerase, class I n=1 Tax=Microbacterium sp. BWT-B31 TaxID=3232072 RepID=UPI0035276BF0
MLVPITNLPRDYAWGSTSLIAGLEGREPTRSPEAEVWFGDHPGSPARLPDGRTLDRWLTEEGAAVGAPVRLPYLLKLLAAASPLSIQAHPSKAQAVAGYAREEAAGIPRDAAHRTYRDDNHKPELIVAVSDTFVALAGLRELGATGRLLRGLGEAGTAVADRLDASTPRDVIAWLLSGQAAAEVDGVISEALEARSDEFAAELSLLRRFGGAFPHDPGLVVALLMNLVTLRRGEALFVDAGVLHAYVEGLGVEIMAASDNVVRGGLTPKHVDVAGLLEVVDGDPAPPPLLVPEQVAANVDRYAPPVPDFALLRVQVDGEPVSVPLDGAAIVLAVSGSVSVSEGTPGDVVALTPGKAGFAAGAARISLTGEGEVFVAEPGR